VTAAAASPVSAIGSVLTVPSPATDTHSTPDPEPPSSVRPATIGAGSTTSISFDDPAVLTTLPPTCTGADDVVGVLSVVDPAPEQPASQHANRVSAAIAAVRLFDRLIEKTVVIGRITVGFPALRQGTGNPYGCDENEEAQP